MTTSQSHRDKADDEVWGRCNVCRELVIYGERHRHPCEGYYVDTSWHTLVNPDNTPGLPGYRFAASQASGARTGHKNRGHTHMTPRTYRVSFEIGQDGRVRHTGGPKPTDSLMAAVEEMCARERPGSNWYPGCEDEPPCCGPGLEGL